MSGPKKTRLSVLSWNIWWQFGPWQDRAPAILATLKAQDPDIICLQEVWGNERENYAQLLANDLGYSFVYAPGARPNGIHMGNAILSRWPIVQNDSVSLFDLPKAPELRVAVFAEIDGPRGKIPVFCTHLNWMQHHSHVRQEQVAELAGFIGTKLPGKYPPILCGDFNADPISDEIRMITGQTNCPVDGLVFHDSWTFVNQTQPGYTWDNSNAYVAQDYEPNRRIDYIFAGWPKANGAGHVSSCKVVGNRPVNGVWPSDHFALLAELQY